MALRNQLNDVNAQFTHITSAELPGDQQSSRRQGWARTERSSRRLLSKMTTEHGAGGSAPAGQNDPDARLGIELPRNLRLWN